jgi:tRNA threonylcarbamoyladenosine biosynthesis protein TsaE
MELVLRAPTPEDTRAIGGVLAPLLRPRDAVILTGELGAGKTTFVQGVALGLGITEHVVSPTFTLIKEYSGRLEVAHVDVYRLDRVQDVVDLGLDELGQGDDLLLVEWGDVVEALLPADRLRVELTVEPDGRGQAPAYGDVEGDTDRRRLVLSGSGASWAERWEPVEHAVHSWSAEP